MSVGKRASLDLGPAGDVGPDVRENRLLLARASGLSPERLVLAEQVHGTRWSAADPATCPRPTRCGPTRPVRGWASGPRTASPSSSAARTAPGSRPSTPDGGAPWAASPRWRSTRSDGRARRPGDAPCRHRPVHRRLLLRGGGRPGGPVRRRVRGGRRAAGGARDPTSTSGSPVRRTLEQAGVRSLRTSRTSPDAPPATRRASSRTAGTEVGLVATSPSSPRAPFLDPPRTRSVDSRRRNPACSRAPRPSFDRPDAARPLRDGLCLGRREQERGADSSGLGEAAPGREPPRCSQRVQALETDRAVARRRTATPRAAAGGRAVAHARPVRRFPPWRW